MQIANIGLDAHHPLAIQFNDQAQDAMGSRMLRPHVDHHVFAIHPTRYWLRLLVRLHQLFAEMDEIFVIPVHGEGNSLPS